jgi:hypothetical protein
MRHEIRGIRHETRCGTHVSGLMSRVTYSAFADLPIKIAIASGTEAPS